MASAPPDSGEEFTHCLHPAATRADLGGVQRVYGLAGGSRGEDALYSWAEGRGPILHFLELDREGALPPVGR